MSQPRSGQVRVLYVDAGDAQRTVRACLESAATLAVRTADSCETAVEAVSEHSVDCVVSEYDLPDGTGLSLLETVRDSRPALPFILYPSDGSEQLAADAAAAGVTDYHLRDPVETTCESLAGAVVSAVDEQAKQQAALDRMTDGFQILDEEWRISYSNERAREVLRSAMSPQRREAIDDLEGEVLWDIVPEAVDTVFYDRYHEAMETQEPVTFEEYYTPLEAWFEVRIYPSPNGLSVYFTDTTDSKQYQQRLENRESVLTAMYRTIADTGRSFEEKLDDLFTIGRRELDTEYATLSRVEGDEYIFEYVQTPDGDAAVEAKDVAPLPTTSCERTITDEETLVVANMDEAPSDIADRAGNVELGLACYLGAPVVVDGTVSGTFCFYGTEDRDRFSRWEVTLVELMASWASYERQRQHREEQLTRERNRLEEFASVVSHDLRNPLNVATSRLELATDDCDSPHLDHVVDAVERMDALIEDVLALARLGEQVVDAEPLDFTAVVQASWASVSTPTADLVVDDGATIVGDDTRFCRLFENLFRNSIDHSPPDDEVTIRVGVLEDSTGFYVEDDGPGIPPDCRDTIFEHGFTTESDGTGFGLSIVANIVEAHGGTVEVTESDAGGARFEVRGIEIR